MPYVGEKKREYDREHSRKRYASDPEYRQRRKESAERWRAKHPAQKRAASRAWYERNRLLLSESKHANRREHYLYELAFKYGLSPEQYLTLLERSNGCCEACGASDQDRVLSVDHCHRSKVVRGILCRRCNIGLGYFRDDPAALRAAAAYLERFGG